MLPLHDGANPVASEWPTHKTRAVVSLPTDYATPAQGSMPPVMAPDHASAPTVRRSGPNAEPPFSSVPAAGQAVEAVGEAAAPEIRRRRTVPAAKTSSPPLAEAVSAPSQVEDAPVAPIRKFVRNLPARRRGDAPPNAQPVGGDEVERAVPLTTPTAATLEEASKRFGRIDAVLHAKVSLPPKVTALPSALPAEGTWQPDGALETDPPAPKGVGVESPPAQDVPQGRSGPLSDTPRVPAKPTPPGCKGTASPAYEETLDSIFRHNASVSASARRFADEESPAAGRREARPEPPREITLNIASLELPPLELPAQAVPPTPSARPSLAEFLKARGRGGR